MWHNGSRRPYSQMPKKVLMYSEGFKEDKETPRERLLERMKPIPIPMRKETRPQRNMKV